MLDNTTMRQCVYVIVVVFGIMALFVICSIADLWLTDCRREANEYCIRTGLNPAKISGPSYTNVGNFLKSVSWEYDDGNKKLELLFNKSLLYGTEIAIWDYNRAN